jgi:hypothetical protein
MLSQQSHLPWCIIGDFNDILTTKDKRGNVPHPRWLLNGFRQAISDCDLIDVSIQGHAYTWARRLGHEDVVEERLDRALVNQSWMNLFPHCTLHNLVSGASDHSPILLNTEHQMYTYKKRQFRFENAWLLEPDIESVVSNGWYDKMEDPLLERLHHCTEELDHWGRKLRRRYKEDIERCKKRIEELQPLANQTAEGEIVTLKHKLNDLLIQEEAFLRQRAKTFWMRDGDMNSKFFHAAATSRKKRNKITKLWREDNMEINTQAGLCQLSLEYFEELFSAGTCQKEPVLQAIDTRLNDHDNHMLTAPFGDDEFRDAIFQMHSDKAPGSDGLNPAFYKHFWLLCGREVIDACNKWLHESILPPSLGDTNIVLIPKCDQPKSMKDLRPISLCNVVYKILAKTLANRLQKVLDKCISDEQSGFVAGRSITDNVLIASEIIHYLKCKTRGNKGEAALKIDISKAYDRVDWSYLFGVMEKMGFDTIWIRWMRMCVTNISYHVLVNDERIGPITPGRGLRQGDPLSPYLFIICAEGMTALLKQAESNGSLHGIKVCRRAPSISHLLFADDSFLFFRANENETHMLKGILDIYANASGQLINMQKSEIYFSRNVSHDLKNNLSQILQVTECLGTGKYLGLPSMIGRSKKSIFNYIKDRIWNRISNWSSKMLSQAGKEVLIKSVAQAIPSYCMSVFLLPMSIGDEIEKMLNSFWWGIKEDGSKGIRWMSWDKLTMRKEWGGMGFRNIYGFNLAMLGKQG